MGLYVGDSDEITLEDGTVVFILRDLSQGADDDLWAFELAQGLPSEPGKRTFWTTKLLHLAILRIKEPELEAYEPTYEQVGQLKIEPAQRLRDEVMSRWFPLEWTELKTLLERELEALEEETEEGASGPSLTTSGATANGHPPGSSG